MKKFEVTITETLKKTVEVEAETQEEAEQIVTDDWYKGEHILDADNFSEVVFDAKEYEPEKIKVVLLEPGKIARATEIDATLEGMQSIVGGDIEPGYYFEEPVCCIVNGEGKMIGLDLNRGVYDGNKQLIDIIAITHLCIFIMTMIYRGLLPTCLRIPPLKVVRVMTRFGIRPRVCS